MSSAQKVKVLWRWRVYDHVTKRRIITRHHMDEETARTSYPDAEKVEWSRLEVSDVRGTGNLM